jgi:hypothetical protein
MKSNILSIALLFCIIILFCIFGSSNREEKNVAEFNREIHNLKQSNSELNESAVGEFVINTAKLKNKILTAKHDTVDLSLLGLTKPLVFYFKESSCNPCIKRELAQIAKLSKTRRDILILAKYQNPRLMAILMREFGIYKNTYALDINEPIFLGVENQPITVLFTVDVQNNIKNAYMPSANNPILSEYYFKSLKAEKI